MSTHRILVTGGPWPERIGLTGHIVQPTATEAKSYPFHGKGQREAVIFLSNDPLNGPGTRYAGHHPSWTCVIDIASFQYLDRRPEFGLLANPCEQCGAGTNRFAIRLDKPEVTMSAEMYRKLRADATELAALKARRCDGCASASRQPDAINSWTGSSIVLADEVSCNHFGIYVDADHDCNQWTPKEPKPTT